MWVFCTCLFVGSVVWESTSSFTFNKSIWSLKPSLNLPLWVKTFFWYLFVFFFQQKIENLKETTCVSIYFTDFHSFWVWNRVTRFLFFYFFSPSEYGRVYQALYRSAADCQSKHNTSMFFLCDLSCLVWSKSFFLTCVFCVTLVFLWG